MGLLWVSLVAFFICCSIGAQQQTTVVSWLFTSSGVSCNSCGSEGGELRTSFACSNDTAGKMFVSPKREARADGIDEPPIVIYGWPAGGAFPFQDPLPSNVPLLIRNVTVSMMGRYDCGANCGTQGHYMLLLNDLAINFNVFPPFPPTSCGCHCGNCGFPLRFPWLQASPVGPGWTAYNRGAQNVLQISLPPFFEPVVICLSRVNLTLTWELAQSTPLAIDFFPPMGPVEGGTQVNISGFNFDMAGEYTCNFGPEAAPAVVYSSTILSCIAPMWVGQLSGPGYTNVPLVILEAGMAVSNFSRPFQYYPQPTVVSLSPASGDIAGGNNIAVRGFGFLRSDFLSCQFGDADPVTAVYNSSTSVMCRAPPWNWGDPSGIPVEVAINGWDFTDNGVTYSYTNVPFMPLWELIALITGCAVGLGLLITIIAVLVYRRARSRDKTRRYLDSDTEGETEPLIASINSKTMRQVLAKVDRVNIEDIRIDRRIGRGSFGEVFHGLWSGTEIAIKKLPKHMLANQKFLEDFAQEISIMAQLRHPNVIQFLGVAVDKSSLFMLTEFMPRGSLYDVLHDKNQDLPLELIVSMLLDTARGMAYLHRRLIHRDLKSHNLLVDQHWTVKICDFGLSRLFEPHLNTLTACGTPCWTAPEVLRNEHYTEKADVYSFGIVMWECLTREDPFAGMPPFHVVFIVGTQGARPEIPQERKGWPGEMLDLMQSCWQENPDSRPPFPDIVLVLQEMLTGKKEDNGDADKGEHSINGNNNNNNEEDK